MAAIKFGAIVTDMRGKLGGHVFQKGNQSRVLKTYGKPRQKSTTAVTTQNNFLRQVQRNWRAASTTIRNQYGVLSGNIVFKNRFADSLVYTAYQFYLHTNMNAIRAGFTLPLLPSSFTQDFPTTVLTAAEINTANATLEITVTGALAGSRFQLLALRAKNPSAKVNVDKFIWFSQFNASIPPNTGLLISLTNRVGPISSGDVIYIGIIVTNPFGLTKALDWLRVTFV